MMKKLTILIFLFVFSFSVIAVDKNAPPVIRVTPPAPKFSDAERQAELKTRRANVLAAMADDSMMILFSAEPKNYAGDVDFFYRQENNLYYLTNLRQTGAMLVLTKNGSKSDEFLFLPERNPAQETWNGKMYSNADAQKLSGVQTIINRAETDKFLQAVKDKKPFASSKDLTINNAANLYLLMPDAPEDADGTTEYRRENEFSKTLANYKLNNARPIFDELRLVKSPMEIKLLQHAIDITIEAQERAMATANQAQWEYEVQAEIEYIFRKRNADYWGYPSIVGCGPNATTLHYEESQGAVNAGNLLLMDVGAEYDHYTADVTRTFPVSGKFSKEQADIYRAVYEAQEAAAKMIKPGARYSAPSQAATKVLKENLAKLGLITAPDATYQVKYRGEIYEQPQYQIWYMHGWGHWLGMNVHDVGGGGATILKAGMVTTNEPGIYIREDALDYLADTPANKEFLKKIKPAYEKYKNIGVRIEDDMLVTETGVEWMTKNLPRKLEDVEAFIAQASKQAALHKTSNLFAPTLAYVNFSNADILNWQPFAANESMRGTTIRRGWILNGKDTAFSGMNNSPQN